MDEPFGALDAQAREVMQEALLEICLEERQRTDSILRVRSL